MTDFTAQIAAMNRVLAGATRECPCKGAKNVEDDACPRCLSAQSLGTGRIARFPEFRQECQCLGDERYTKLGCPKCWYLGAHSLECIKCNGTSWQVRAGGLHDALAGLTRIQATKVLRELTDWMSGYASDPTSPADEILDKGLELVTEIAE